MKSNEQHLGETTVLPEHTNLSYSEVYAKNVLHFLDSACYGNLILSDKPDLIDLEQSVGIEVTDASDPRFIKAASLYSRLGQLTNDQKKEIFRQEIKKCGAELNGGILCGPCLNDSFDLILDAYGKKLEKLNGGEYQQLNRYELFLLSTIMVNERMCEDALNSMLKQAGIYSKSYSLVTLVIPRYIIRFDLISSAFDIVPFDSNSQFHIANASRREVIEGEHDPRIEKQ